MVRVVITLLYECETPKDAIDVVMSVARETYDYSNKGLKTISVQTELGGLSIMRIPCKSHGFRFQTE